MMLFYIDR